MKERRLPCESKERRKQKQRKRSKKRGLDFLVWCSQENRIRRRLLGQQNQIRRVDNWGGIHGRLGKKNHTPFFPTFSTFLHSHSNFPTKIISLCIYVYIHIYIYIYVCVYIYIYIYPYLYKVISITFKEHICFITSQNQSFMHLKVSKIITCI